MISKSIKRLAAVIITAAVALSFCSCALFDAVTAYSLYKGAVDKLKKAGGYEADCAMTLSIDVLGQPITTDMNMNIKNNGENSQTTTDVMGSKMITTTMGDTVYVEYDGLMIKYPKTDSDSKDVAIEDSDVLKLTKDVFEGIEIESLDDGNKSVTVDLKGDSAQSIIKAFLGDEDETLTLENVTMTIIFNKKKEIVSMNILCDAEISVMGLSVGGKLSAEYVFVNFGTAPEIKLNHPESAYQFSEDHDML